MARKTRIKGLYNTYHIILRGIEKKDIFLSNSNYLKFLEILTRCKNKYNCEIDGYCLMSNHVHLIIDDNGNDISQIMKSINTSYAMYFNKQYKRVGHLFQDRFKSEVVNDEKYLLVLSSYIHNNPVMAGIVKTPENYRWSSFPYYIGRYYNGLVRTERILSQISSNLSEAMKEYYRFVLKYELSQEEVNILDINEDEVKVKGAQNNYIATFEEGKKRLEKELSQYGGDLCLLKKDKEARRRVMSILRKNSSLTLKEIGDLCGGFSEAMVSLILKGKR